VSSEVAQSRAANGKKLDISALKGNAVKHFETAFSGLFAVAAFARTREDSPRAPHSGECCYENASALPVGAKKIRNFKRRKPRAGSLRHGETGRFRQPVPSGARPADWLGSVPGEESPEPTAAETSDSRLVTLQ
jgi:hypothetical protein